MDLSVQKAAQAQPVLAIVGSPNCGKTTLFNSLTGARHKVANYPGVTVDKRFGTCLSGDVKVIDLPGIYSLGAVSPDELVATRTLLGEVDEVDGIILVLDASCLERQLLLASQVLDLGKPTLVVLSMMDLAEAHGLHIRGEKLARILGTTVLANRSKGASGQLNEEIRQFVRMMQAPEGGSRDWSGSREFERHALSLGKSELGDVNDALARSVGYQLISGSRRPDKESTAEILTHTLSSLRAQGVDPMSFETTSRFRWARDVVSETLDRSEATTNSVEYLVDKIVTHRFWGAFIFFAVLAGLFQIVFQLSALPMEWVEICIEQGGNLVSGLMGKGLITSLLVDGVIMGVGNVVVFVPQIALLFFCLSLLEESGYLARAAHVMDRPMRAVGLQGRSFVPMLNSFACAIPGIMATRTIASYGDRLTTIMVAPLMSCSARLPVYTVLIGAVIPATMMWGVISLQGTVLLGLYLLGIIGAAVIAFLLKQTVLRGQPTHFILELPRFRRPSLKTALRTSFDKSLDFIRSAGTIILACSIVLWALASFPREVPIQDTYAGRLGRAMEPVVEPLGYNWEISIGILSSFVAREVFVTTLATVYNLEDSDTQSQSLTRLLKERRAQGEFTLPTGLSLLVFYVFACQCMSTLAVVKAETDSYGWTVFMFVYMSALAYFSAFATYSLSTWALT